MVRATTAVYGLNLSGPPRAPAVLCRECCAQRHTRLITSGLSCPSSWDERSSSRPLQQENAILLWCAGFCRTHSRFQSGIFAAQTLLVGAAC